LTHDHTLAQELADRGLATERDVIWQYYRNALSRAIGIPETGGDSEILRLRLADGDRLLLCTDGLTDMVDGATIGAELSQQASPARLAGPSSTWRWIAAVGTMSLSSSPVITSRRARAGTPPVWRTRPAEHRRGRRIQRRHLAVPAGHVTTGGDFSLRHETVPRMISA
jgi:protein phosphatase